MISIICEDGFIVVDGEAIQCDFVFPSQYRAFQWYGDEGHVELTNGTSESIGYSDIEYYIDIFNKTKKAKKVKPSVTIWEKNNGRD